VILFIFGILPNVEKVIENGLITAYWTVRAGVFLALSAKKSKKRFQANARAAFRCGHGHNAEGNDAAADSMAAFSFASMERMLQSMAAVNTTAKREVLSMA
jgi:hypothetical protein